MAGSFSISDISYLKRVIVGRSNPEQVAAEETIQKQMDFLNRCLNENPKGKIIGMEKNFYLLNIGEHQVVMQYVVYHVGFVRKPAWWE